MKRSKMAGLTLAGLTLMIAGLLGPSPGAALSANQEPTLQPTPEKNPVMLLTEIKARAWFGPDGMHIVKVLPGSTLLEVKNAAGKSFSFEKGDLISAINAVKLVSKEAYLKALLTAPPKGLVPKPSTMTLNVVDVQTGKTTVLLAENPTPAP